MKNETKQNKRIEQALELLQVCPEKGRHYWLAAMVKHGDLTESEAGYILFNKLI